MLMGEEVRLPMPWGSIAGKAWGIEGGPPTLCIHGFNDNAATFDRLIPHLLNKSDFFLAIDLPGHGRSSHYPHNSQLSTVEFLADIKRIYFHFNWSKATILCHSMGSRMGLYFAAAFPMLVSKIITIDLAPGIILFEKDHICDLFAHEINLLIQYQNGDFINEKYMTEEEAYAKYKESRIDDLDDEVILPLFHRTITKEENKVRFSRDKRNTNLIIPFITEQLHTAVISRIKCPTLLILSEAADMIFQENKSFRHTFDILKMTLKNKLTILETNMSHHMHIDEPEKIASIISGFMTIRNKL